jgi:hypothetical protein
MPAFQFADFCVAGFAFNHGHNRTTMPFTDHRITLPIPETPPAVDYF